MAFWQVFLVVVAVCGLPVSRAGSCLPFWTQFRGNCYRFMGHYKSWSDAEDHCQGFFVSSGQGHLASIQGADENAFLFKLWRSSARSTDSDGTSHLWIGLYEESEEVYAWSDGTAFDYTNWISGNPSHSNDNEHCGELHIRPDEIGWNDNVCNVAQPHICKINTMP